MKTAPDAGTMLVPNIGLNFLNPAEKEAFFSEGELQDLKKYQRREQPEFGKPGESCKTNLFFGFFFDGTKNNYIDAENGGNNHSNVARLYDCYPGLCVPKILPRSTDWTYKPDQFNNFFKVYIPGVASKFEAVQDSGEGVDGIGGGAAGLFGERRIVWAMIQAINNLHRFYLKAPLIAPPEALLLVKRIALTHQRRELFRARGELANNHVLQGEKLHAKMEFIALLERLHAAISGFMITEEGSGGYMVGPGTVKTIHISTFGFSRGATQARAFNNWMISLCELDAQMTNAKHTHTLGGFRVSFDFLGLYDTVASVGAGNSFGNVPLLKLFDGHGGWADTEHSLRVTPGVPCVHLVAAHELRRSFPSDSISVEGQLQPNWWEIVIPGVHSDLGCGYAPQEQGKGKLGDGTDMLARIPLAVMYKMARLAGVPLKLEYASEVAKDRFAIQKATIEHLNNYLAVCKVKSGSLTAIMREQARLQMEWRLSRRSTGKTPIERTQFYSRCNMLDKNDFHSAFLEFEQETADFEEWKGNAGKNFKPEQQLAGFSNDHKSEWEEIARWYQPYPTVSEAVAVMFDEYVHDSRSWFKIIPGNPDSVKATKEKLDELCFKRDEGARLRARAAQMKATFGMDMRQGRIRRPEDSMELTPEELKLANAYTAGGKEIPPMITKGREPYAGKNRAGYLRFRKIYGGKDSVLLSSVPPENDSRGAT
ncbi:T6SS phospholipase effector Tle1-like catalytic domain-containing protein [Massilia sp. TWP1-3-3]|uniref:T6SS phospholipase effector Tle1-like catalytic domain-containing protein n=1 Tax=Massilia sp. TWP1-3-3 TaxID=2804573 RepID=UPI003CE8758E